MLSLQEALVLLHASSTPPQLEPNARPGASDMLFYGPPDLVVTIFSASSPQGKGRPKAGRLAAFADVYNEPDDRGLADIICPGYNFV